MGWHIYEKLLEKVANYSPFVGKIWIVFIFIFRLIVVTSIGDTIYEDEQEEFECNTHDPGCRPFCFTQFSPVSQIRFWAMQLLFIGTPSMIFIVYTLHKITLLPPQASGDAAATTGGDQKALGGDDGGNEGDYRRKGGRRGRRRRRRKRRFLRERYIDPDSLPNYKDVLHPETNSHLITQEVQVVDGKLKTSKEGLMTSSTDDDSTTTNSSDEDNFKLKKVEKQDNEADEKAKKKKKVKTKTVYHQDGSEEIFETPSIARAYFLQAVARMLIEGGFLYLQWIMYGWEVLWYFDCTGEPCTKEIRCYVSRPKEKTYLLQFMYVMEGLSLLLCVVEIAIMIIDWIRRRSRKQRSPNEPLNMNSVLPLTHVITDNRNTNGMYRRAVQLNTFPNLGPYPLRRDNSVGGSTRNGAIQSDHGGYFY